jgi:hypothetical protein
MEWMNKDRMSHGTTQRDSEFFCAVLCDFVAKEFNKTPKDTEKEH